MKNLNNIYIDATSYYELEDIIGIYKICNNLNISYDIEVEDEILISEKINYLKSKISFMENTLTYKWLNSEDNSDKDNIILNYIRMRIE